MKGGYNAVVITVPADGLAPNGAKPSAGTVMKNFLSQYISHLHYIYFQQQLVCS